MTERTAMITPSTKLTRLFYVIAAVQLLLGVLYLALPDWLLLQMGHSPIAADIRYPLAMLAARFIAVGLAMLWLAKRQKITTTWVQMMVGIQAIDLAAGVFYTLSGVVEVALSGFAMFNAALFIVLLIGFSRPRAAAPEQMLS